MTRITHDGGRWSNADLDVVEPVAYDPAWRQHFAAEAVALRVHFGSTAIPGLPAKPILDIVLVVAERQRWHDLIQE